MSTTPVLSANFSGLTTEINRVFSVMSGKTPVLSGPIGATGPGGPTGPIGATGSTGPIGIGIGTTLKGTWSSSGTYGLNSGSPDAVTYNGAFYVCLNNGVTGSTTPDQDTTNWLRYVQQGGTGPTGPSGATGLPGATGIGIGTTLQGRWQTGANYYSRSGVNADAVTYSGGFYVCINTVTPSTVSPNLDTANWLAYVDIGPTGATGSLGIDGVTGPTGPVGIGIGTTLKGAWVAGQAYSTNSGTNPDAVTYEGSLYICIQAVTSSVTPDQDPTKWQLYVRQGGTGPSGPPGASGLTGVTGLKGDTGFTGPSGATGLKGDTGMTGPAGSISSAGSDGELLYNRGGVLGATGSMLFRSTGPTGPLGQATGPIGQPTLQLGAYLLPTTDATYDLGATGIQFKDVHFSGSLYNNGVPFSGGGGGVSGLTYRATGPTGPLGQATGPAPNPTLQMAAYLIPTTDATYDLGATGIRFKDEFLSGSLYMGATGATGVNILQTGRIPSHTLEDTTTGPKLNYSQTLTKPGLYTTTAIYGSLTPDASVQIQYTPKVILNSARGYATGPTALINGDILGAVMFNENGTGPGQYRALIVSRKTGAAETNDASIEFGTIQGGGRSQMIINSTGPTGPTGDPTGPVGKNIGLNAHMYPMDDAIYNLGATGYQFKDVHFSGSLYNNGTAFQGGVSGLTYRATGPTGPDGQATGPAPYPTLQMDAYLIPTTDATYDLGATGIQFKDVHFSGTIYNNGTAFQGGVSGLTYRATGPTGPTGQPTGPTGPTLQINAHLVPTEDLTYDLGATGLRFRDLYVGGTSIHLGDNLTLSSTNDNLTVTNQYGTNSVMEKIDTLIPEINGNLTSPNLGEILSVATSATGPHISIAMKATINSVANTYIIGSTDGGLTTSIPPGFPTAATGPGPIVSIAMTPSGLYQVAALGPKDGLDYTGTIKRSSNSGATWATINTDSPAAVKLRKYTSISISSSGGRIVATHLLSGSGETAVSAGFIYTSNGTATPPTFTKVTDYTVPGGSLTIFVAPRFVSIDQTGSRFVIMDVVDANTTDIICFNIVSGTATCAGKFTYISGGTIIKNIIVSNVTSVGFNVKYTSGISESWNHYIDTYIWSNISITPLKSEDLTANIYIDTTPTDSTDLQLICSNDGVTQVLLPTYTSGALSLTDGIHISYNSGTSWTFLDNASNGIATSATKNVTAIALTDTGIYSFLYDSSAPNITKLYKQEFKHLYSNQIVNVKNGTSGLNYVPLGPTGPTGQPTGPTGPALQLSAAILPTQDLTYDLGAAGLRFRDLYVGGSSIHLGDSMSIKSTSGDFTVEYQPNNNNTTLAATLIETTTSSLIATSMGSDIAFTYGGEIISVVAATEVTSFNIAINATIGDIPKNYIINFTVTEAGGSQSIIFEPQAISTGGQITSMAMSEDGTLQLAVFGGNIVGYIQYSSNSGTSWAAVSTSPTKRKYTSVALSSTGNIMAATYSSSTSPTVLAGFVYSTDFTEEPPTFTPVTSYGPDGVAPTNFTAPSFTTLGSEGRRLIVVDVRAGAGQSDVILFDMESGSGSPEYVTTITFNSTSIIVSKLGQYSFSVLYKEGSANNWTHKVNRYRWYYSAEPTPELTYSATIYTDTTESGITDLQFLYSPDGQNQVILPTYTVGSEAITDGVYIANNGESIWRFLSNTDQSIPTTTDPLTTVKAIALDSAVTGIYSFLYDTSADPHTINIYKGVLQPATSAIIKNGLTNLTYVPSTQSFEISAPIIPAANATHDLGATGYQFRDIFFSDNIYKGGVPFSGGIIAPTDNFMVAGGDGVGLAYSYDGTNWTSVTQVNISECTAVAWNGLIWVAGVISDGGESIAYSSDGINWSLSSQTVVATCLAVAWNGSIWLAGGTSAGGGNAIAYSYDGINWTASPQTVISGDDPNGGSATCRALASNGLIWVAGASATNKMAYSVDGINWTASESANTEFTETGHCNSVAWNGTMWVAGGQSTVDGAADGVILYSYDGMNWIPASFGDGAASFLGRYYSIAWNGSLWVAGGAGGKPEILQSSDGILWASVTDIAGDINLCRSITWNGTMWLAAGEASSGILANSTDGLTWTAVAYPDFTGTAYTVVSRRVLPFVGTGGSMPGLYYRASGPTGPTGGQTGPTGPWLQVSANIVPVADNVFDLGATGLRFRDIHVGGSTIYLGDSVSIKATNEGALSVTNNAGTVNLVTPTGLNGGTLSGTGTASNNSGVYYGEHVFSSPFAYPPIVIASINALSFINSKLYIPKETVTETECRIYSDVNGTSYNWIATARTEYPFEFYNVTTPITEVDANPTSLVLSVNTSLLLRGGLPPYTDVEIQATGGGNPGFTAVPITINTGVQQITINELTVNQSYSINITATDSSASPVTITSDPQDFSTIPIPPITTAGVLALVDGTTTSTGVQCEVVTNATGGTPPYTYTIEISPVEGSISPGSYVDELGIFTITGLTPGTAYDITLTTTDSMGSTSNDDPVPVTTDYAPLNIGTSEITTAQGDTNEEYTSTNITVVTTTQDVSGGSGSYTFRLAYSPTNSTPTFDGNNSIESPWIDIGESELNSPVIAFNLIGNITYYFIMFASDSTAIELQPVFTTPIPQATATPAAPTVTTTSAGFNTANGDIELVGEVTASGTSPIEYSGMCYGTTNPPTIANIIASNQGTLPAILAFDNPAPGTYYARAYATNEEGLTGYGTVSTVVVPPP